MRLAVLMPVLPVVMALTAAVDVRAQSALRVRGSVQSVNATGIPATVELTAVYGFRGLDFVGQKTFSARAGDRGQWSVLGVTSGAWLFAAHSQTHLPQVVGLPVQFTQKNPASAAGGQVPWEVGFDLAPRDQYPALGPAADAALRGARGEVASALAPLLETADAPTLVAAGEIALYVRDSGLARAIFERALAKDPTLGRASLGLATAAVLEGAWDRAAKAFWAARDQGISPRLARAVGAAITELQRIAVPDGAAGCRGGGPGC